MLLQHDWGYCNVSLGWGTLEGLATFGTNVLVQVSTKKKPFNAYHQDFQGYNISNYYPDHYTKDTLWLCYYCHPSLPTLPANPPTVDALNEATV